MAAAVSRSAEIVADSDRHEYYAINPYCSPIRRSGNVYSLANIAIDVDIHGNYAPWHLNVLKDDLYERLMAATDGGSSPLAPTVVVDSGHGMQLIWCLERSVPCGSSAVDSDAGQRLYDMVWHDLAAWLDLQLRSLPYAIVDRAVVGDRARLMRTPGTVNGDQMASVRLDTGRKHSLRQLMGRLDKVRKSRIYRPSIRPDGPGAHSDLCLDQRLADLEHYVTAHRGAVRGQRNILAHLYANTLRGIYGLSGLDMQDDLLATYNRMFAEPLAKAELASVSRSVTRFFHEHGRPYYYKLSTIAELLGLSEREVGEWFGRSSRKEQERSARRIAREQRNDEIRAMSAAGAKQAEIAAVLGVSAATVSRVLRGGVPASVLKAARADSASQMASQGLLQADIADILQVDQATVSRDMQNCKIAPELVVAPSGTLGVMGPLRVMEVAAAGPRCSTEDVSPGMSAAANAGQGGGEHIERFGSGRFVDLAGMSVWPPG